MLENLMNLVKEQAGSSIINNPAIPDEKNDEAVNMASESVTGGLQNALASGNMKDVLGLFSNSNEQHVANNAVTQNIQGNFITNLMNKFGLSNQQASGVASGLIPGVLQKLVHKTNDPNDSSFNMQGILNKLSGGKTSGMNVDGLMAKFKSGLDIDKDGDTDLQDLKAAFSGGIGGLTDKLKGLF